MRNRGHADIPTVTMPAESLVLGELASFGNGNLRSTPSPAPSDAKSRGQGQFRPRPLLLASEPLPSGAAFWPDFARPLPLYGRGRC
jgi:hypothetical protein